MIPLYGFRKGDSIGLLILAYENETIGQLAEKLQHSAKLRVSMCPKVRVLHRGKILNPSLTVGESDLEALDRFDVINEDF